MEHRINKVDVELIQRVNESKSEKHVQKVDEPNNESNMTEYEKRKEKNQRKRKNKTNKIVIDTYKLTDKIDLIAEKENDGSVGVYLDTRR